MAITDRAIRNTLYSNTTIAQQQAAQKKAQEAAAQRIAAAKREATKAKAQANAKASFGMGALDKEMAAAGLPVYAPSPYPVAAPKQIQAEVGDTWDVIAEKVGVPTKSLLEVNPKDTTIKAGTFLNAPDPRELAGWSQEEIFEDIRNPFGSQSDRIKYQEELNVYGTDKFGTPIKYTSPLTGKTYDTYDPNSQPYETDAGMLQFPEGMNTERFKHWVENIGTASKWFDSPFMQSFNNMDLSREGVFNLPTMSMTGGEIDPRWQSYTAQELSKELKQYYPSEIRGPSGMPSDYKWEKGTFGEWTAKPAEAVFDSLYEANGIDPNDPDAVEWFWSLADDNLIFMGEFFDVLDWPTGGGGRGYGGGGGGGGGGYPRQAQRQQQRDYNSYLSLTSWSI